MQLVAITQNVFVVRTVLLPPSSYCALNSGVKLNCNNRNLQFQRSVSQKICIQRYPSLKSASIDTFTVSRYPISAAKSSSGILFYGVIHCIDSDSMSTLAHQIR